MHQSMTYTQKDWKCSNEKTIKLMKNSLKNSRNSFELISDESHWIEDLENHLYPKRRPLEELELLEVQLGKKNLEEHYGR